MILYTYPKAPNPMRVDIFLSEKVISIKNQLVDLRKNENITKNYLALNPWGTVPFLMLDNGEIIAESIAICRYFEALQPEPCLFGKTPYDQAKIEMWRRRIENDGMSAIGESLRNKSMHFKNRALAGPKHIKQIPELIKRGEKRAELFFNELDKQLMNREYVVTNNFTIADIDAYVSCSFAKWLKIDATDNRTNIKRWLDLIIKRKSIKSLNT